MRPLNSLRFLSARWPVEFLEALIRSQHEHRPRVELLGDSAELFVHLFDFAALAETLPVRRVTDEHAVLRFRLQRFDGQVLQADRIGHLRLPDVVVGERQNFRVDVRADDLQGTIHLGEVFRLFARLVPDALRHDRPIRSGEVAEQARCDVAADQRRFNRDRARAAERVDQRTVRLPARQVDDRGRQRLFQRRLRGQRTVAALVQACAGGVERDRGDVFVQGDLDAVERAVFIEPLDAVRFFHLLDDRLFDDALTGWDRGKL